MKISRARKSLAKAVFAALALLLAGVRTCVFIYNTCQKSLGHFQKIMKNYSLISISTTMP